MLVFLIKSKNNFGVTDVDRPDYHDWNAMLIDIGKLESHREVASAFDTTGISLNNNRAALGWLFTL